MGVFVKFVMGVFVKFVLDGKPIPHKDVEVVKFVGELFIAWLNLMAKSKSSARFGSSSRSQKGV
jgi:hypothetical protein